MLHYKICSIVEGFGIGLPGEKRGLGSVSEDSLDIVIGRKDN
jgi:hypothetical protein